MFGRRLRSLLALGALAAVLVRLVQALRGDPTTTFSNHLSVGGDRVAGHLTLALAPVDKADALPADDGADPPIVPGTPFDPEPEPELAALRPIEQSATLDEAPSLATWAHPVVGGCPDGYPVKAKLKSGIFHLPGMSAYERTTPDRCYPDAASAEADGLRSAKR